MNELTLRSAKRKEWSPRALARATGAFYLLTLLTGIFAQGYVSGRLIVSGDAAATAANVLGNRALYQAGFAVYLVEMLCNVAFTALFYELLKPVSRRLSLAAAIFGLVGCAIKTLSRVFYLAPIFVLGGAPYLKVFGAPQLNALSLLLLEVNDAGAAIALVFFGVYALVKGWLIFHSTFLPRALGVLSAIGGAGWLAFLYPPLAYRIFPYIVALGLLGALANVAWLLAVGVDERRWREQAGETI